MAKDLVSLIQSKRVVICCGSGGVGKTTTSAAIGMMAASRGLKTIVLTIDPAKRLANSLGIKDIDYREREIPPEEFARLQIPLKGSLTAMMMDTKRTFDALIRRYASSPDKAQAILENKLYQHLSNMMAGSQEYMAMEKLYEMVQDRDYDLIVLDTPPSRHALDFLEAPEKMRNMIGDSVMKLFLKPSLFVSRAGFKLLDNTMRRIMNSFDKVAGFDFLQDISAMLVTTSGLLEGFQERAEKVQKLLHDPKTSFLLIASPQPIPLREADYFYKKINEFKLPFSGFIFNRVEEEPEGLEDLPKGLTPPATDDLQEVKRLFKKLKERDHRLLKSFQKNLKREKDSIFFCKVPQLNQDVHDLKTLYLLGNKLFNGIH